MGNLQCQSPACHHRRLAATLMLLEQKGLGTGKKSGAEV